MDEFRDEQPDDEFAGEEVNEELEIGEMVGTTEEETRAETADLARLLRQHPEIWIPYEEQIQEQLHTRAPGEPTATSGLNVSLRNLNALDATHCTYPFLTNYERTKCISYRASMLSHGAKPYILVPEGVTDAYEIARMELEAKRLPFILQRPLPDGTFEVWRLTDLLLI
jgi:DNA-directed RNA polymerase subunit K/omega